MSVEGDTAMLLGALCEACRMPIGRQATNVQLVTDELVQSTGGVSLRGTRPPSVVQPLRRVRGAGVRA